jgi:hypothetical protein
MFVKSAYCHLSFVDTLQMNNHPISDNKLVNFYTNILQSPVKNFDIN